MARRRPRCTCIHASRRGLVCECCPWGNEDDLCQLCDELYGFPSPGLCNCPCEACNPRSSDDEPDRDAMQALSLDDDLPLTDADLGCKVPPDPVSSIEGSMPILNPGTRTNVDGAMGRRLEHTLREPHPYSELPNAEGEGGPHVPHAPLRPRPGDERSVESSLLAHRSLRGDGHHPK